MEDKKLYIKGYDWNDVEVVLGVTTYAKNNQIAILLYTPDWDCYSDLSVFVQPFEHQNFMAIDINNLPNAEEFIKKYNLGELVGYTHSWFVSYPIYKMDLDELREYDELWVKELEKNLVDGSTTKERTVWDAIR